MKLSESRWGQVVIQQQGENGKFDASKSFSVEVGDVEYSIEQFAEILKTVTQLSNKISFEKLAQKLAQIR